MNRRLIVRPEAEADITEAAVWYESRESGLGLEVTDEYKKRLGELLTILRPFRVFASARPSVRPSCSSSAVPLSCFLHCAT